MFPHMASHVQGHMSTWPLEPAGGWLLPLQAQAPPGLSWSGEVMGLSEGARLGHSTSSVGPHGLCWLQDSQSSEASGPE